MNPETLLQPLQQLLTQVQLLLAFAHAENWDAIQIEMVDYQKRAVLLEDEIYLQSLKDANLVIEAQGLMLQIQGFNQQVDEHAEAFHEKVASELRQMNLSNKALDAYRR